MKMRNFFVLIPFLLLTISCDKKDESATATQTYSFTSAGSAKLTFSSSPLLLNQNLSAEGGSPKGFSSESISSEGPTKISTLSTGPTLCSSVVCFTATSLTGKYYGLGFSIQSAGNGMVAYFGQDSWSGITGTSASYSFDVNNPVVNSGTLTCCNGSGNLSSSNTYIESVMYLFSYLDATFTISGITSNTTMNQSFTVRFVFATDAITSGVRGDLLIKDLGLPLGQGGADDGVFKWISISTGALSSTRPSDPVTMNSSITNYVNPWGPGAGNQSIPVIYTPVFPIAGSGLFTISETELKTSGKTYSFKFDPTNFIMFPSLQTTDLNSIFNLKALLQNIHLGGLPHSGQSRGVGNPAATILTTTSP